jgi:hypothetical protein
MTTAKVSHTADRVKFVMTVDSPDMFQTRAHVF